MAKDTLNSVAPKERVNISYRPANNKTSEKVELPFKLMVLGAFATDSNDLPVAERLPKNVNRANINEVLSSANVTMNYSVDNHLVEGGDDIDVQFNVNNMKDFEPDSILTNVPELKNVIELRNALKALKGPIGNMPAFRKKLKVMLDDSGQRQTLKNELGIK